MAVERRGTFDRPTSKEHDVLPDAWMMLSYGRDSNYAGHDGYVDDPRQVYRYDSFVHNHRRIKRGDIAVLVDRYGLIGLATIESLSDTTGTKTRFSCPNCSSRRLSRRKTGANAYRCYNGHVFDVPVASTDTCVLYIADFGESFVATPAAVSRERLRAACPRYSNQTSMQAITLAAIANELLVAAPASARLICDASARALDARSDAAVDQHYTPTIADERRSSLRALLVRHGQSEFRAKLVGRYGARCTISGCTVLASVEAAHIMPFRSANDHHAENGLLLRADLHTLFDRHLLGIEPDNLRIALHPALQDTEYSAFDGRSLACEASAPPSNDALRARWQLFIERRRQPL